MVARTVAVAEALAVLVAVSVAVRHWQYGSTAVSAASRQWQYGSTTVALTVVLLALVASLRWANVRGGIMRSADGEKNAGKCGKMRKKCGKMR